MRDRFIPNNKYMMPPKKGITTASMTHKTRSCGPLGKTRTAAWQIAQMLSSGGINSAIKTGVGKLYKISTSSAIANLIAWGQPYLEPGPLFFPGRSCADFAGELLFHMISSTSPAPAQMPMSATLNAGQCHSP